MHENAEEVPGLLPELDQALPTKGSVLAAAMDGGKQVLALSRQALNDTQAVMAIVHAALAVADDDLDRTRPRGHPAWP